MKKLSDFYESRLASTELIKRVSSLIFVEVDDGVYDILGDVNFDELGLNSLLEVMTLLKEFAALEVSIRIGRVQGSFRCSFNYLTDLKGAPEIVERDFVCYHNRLETLEGAPKYVGGHFVCVRNKLKDLTGAPQYVGGDFDCSHNQLVSLIGAPRRIGRHFDCSFNQLQTLQGAPEYVGGMFICHLNKLISLEGAPKYIGEAFIYGDNPRKFTEEEVRKLINVGGKVYVQEVD